MLWGLHLTIRNNIDHVLTKWTYKPLGSFGCMSIILGTCQEIVHEDSDRLWHDGFTLFYVYVWLSLASSSFQIQKVVTIRFSVHPLRTQNPMVNKKEIVFSVDPQRGDFAPPKVGLTKTFRCQILFICHGRHDANRISLKLMNENVFLPSTYWRFM